MNSEPNIVTELSARDAADLRYARTLLEHPGLAARLAGRLGSPIERGFELLPKGWSAVIQKATRTALLRALNVALATLGRGRPAPASNFLHKVLVGTSGAVGGGFGLAALPVELPVSTAIMLRSIADIARSEGHTVADLETRLACLEVFALGGPGREDDAAENAYWAVRAVLAKSISDAAAYLANRSVVEESAPAVVRLVAAIAARFGVVVSEQAAAKAVPVVGAAAGSVINVMFMDHFQKMARGHFIVKRLEAKYGTDLVRATYDGMT